MGKKSNFFRSYTFIKLLIKFVLIIPYSLAIALGRGLAFLAWVFDSYHRKTAILQMKTVLGNDYHPGMSLAVFFNHSDIAVDTIRYAYMHDNEIKKKIVIEGKENLKKAYSSGKGILLITGHIGNWEILAHIPRLLGHNFCVMADERKDPEHESIINEIRSRSGAIILPSTGKILMMVKDLKKGKNISIVIDKRGESGTKHYSMIFGIPALTNPAPAFIAYKGNAIILPAYAIRKGYSYTIRFDPPVDSQSFGIDSIQNITDYMQSWIESVVRQYPTHWFWLYSRWTTRSDMRKLLKTKGNLKEHVLNQFNNLTHTN